MKSKKKNSLSNLKSKADKYFSLYVRHRDGIKGADKEYYAKCITCDNFLPIKQLHAGHFQSRRYPSTRYDKENVNAQCAKCNTFNAGEQYKYGLAVDAKYGIGTAEKLASKAQEFHKLTTDELEDIINEAKSFLNVL